MTFFFKISSLMALIFLLNCDLGFPESEPEGFTPEAMLFVNKILSENNATEYTVDIQRMNGESDMFRGNPKGYILGVKVKSILVLTNTIDSLRLNGGIYVKYDNNMVFELPFMGISAKCDTLDSIKIITDSVIVLKHLGLGFSNLTHLPPEIGIIRTEWLDLSYNYKTLKYLPDELMQISEPPYYFDTLIVSYDMGSVGRMSSESVSDSLKS